MTKTKRNKQHEKVLRDLLKELPYFTCKGNLADFHGRFNNLLQSNIRLKRHLDKLTSLYELDLFKINTLCNSDVNTIDNLFNQCIHSRYFSPHSFKEQNKYVIENDDDSFLIFHHNLIRKNTSNEAFQALWIELSFASKKNIICGIIYRQHNSPECFLEYFKQTLEKFISTGKNVCVMGDFNLCLLKSEVSEFSHNFLLSLQSCYLIPTIDKPSRVSRQLGFSN